jgi:hypothetical protein
LPILVQPLCALPCCCSDLLTVVLTPPGCVFALRLAQPLLVLCFCFARSRSVLGRSILS